MVLAFSKALGGLLVDLPSWEDVFWMQKQGLKMPEVHIQVEVCLKRRPEACSRTTDPSSRAQGQGKPAHLVCREKLGMGERSDAGSIRGCQHVNLEPKPRSFGFSGATQRC